MNIAFFPSAFHPSVGGVEELTRQLCHAHRAAGHEVMVVVNRWPRSLPAYEEYEGIPVHRLPLRVPTDRLKPRATYRLTHRRVQREVIAALKKQGADVIHVQCAGCQAEYALAAKRALGLPLVVTLQGELSMDANGIYARPGRARERLRELLAEADAITGCSADTLAEAEAFYGEPFGRIGDGKLEMGDGSSEMGDGRWNKKGTAVSASDPRSPISNPQSPISNPPVPTPRGRVIHNGIDLGEFEAVEPYQHDRPYVFAIGRHVKQKGFDVLLRAWAEIADGRLQMGDSRSEIGDGGAEIADKAGQTSSPNPQPPNSHSPTPNCALQSPNSELQSPNCDLLLAGDGRKHENLKRQAAELGIEGRVHFLGSVDHREAIRLFKGATLFVLPSRHEPFGIVNLEAMAAGTPVIATRVGGVPEFVGDGVNGLLVEAEDPDALAAALTRLMRDAPLRHRLAGQGTRTSRRFDWPAIADTYQGVYQAVLSPHRRDRVPRPLRPDLA